MRIKKYVYYCPLSTCKQRHESWVEPSFAPWCEGEGATHHKEMVFNKEESTHVPEHAKKKSKKA